MNKINETNEKLLCPIKYTLGIVGGKWKLPIICILSSGEPYRFNYIKKRLPEITNMMLTQSLKEMEASGMVGRKQFNEVPPHVEYTLTEKGKSLLKPLESLAEWGIENMHQEADNLSLCENCQAEK